MEDEILCFENLPIDVAEQELSWKLYLAILTSLIELDLLSGDSESDLN